MKIWFDALLDNGKGSDDSQSECGGDCITPLHFCATDTSLSSVEDDDQQIQTLVLQCASLLHIQECAQGRWLVCSPAGAGRIAILDAEAMQLLQSFAAPTTIACVSHATPNCSRQQLARIVDFFYRSGFLDRADSDPAPPTWYETPQLTAWMHLTNSCNLRCSYCYLDKTSDHMASDTARRAVDAVFRSAIRHNIDTVKFKYAGGEASLHMRNVLALHDYATELAQQHDISLKAVILSNGVALSQRAIDALKGRCINVMISLDGLGASHDSQRAFINGQGSSRYVLRTIERLLASDLVPHISITVSRRNLDGLPELLKYILEHDLPFSLNYYRENTCSAHLSDLRFEEQQMIAAMKSAFKMIEQDLPKRSLLGSLLDKTNLSTAHNQTCGVGHNYLVIDQNGGIAKCQADIKRTITTISVDDPLHVIRNDRSGIQGFTVDQKQGCRTCEWRHWCTGGCPLLTYRATGRYDIQSPNCGIYKALFPEVLRLEALRLLRDTTPLTIDSSQTLR